MDNFLNEIESRTACGNVAMLICNMTCIDKRKAYPFSLAWPIQLIKKPPISGFPWQPKKLGERVLQKRLEF